MRMFYTGLLAAFLGLPAAPVAAQTYAYIPNRLDNNVSVIDTASDTVVATVPLSGINVPESLAIHPDGTKVYIGSRIGTISVLDATTLTASPAAPSGSSQVFTLVINPAGTRLYAADFDANVITVIDTTVDPVAVIDTIYGFSGPYAMAFHPSGDSFYVANRFGENVAVVDANTHAVSYIPTPGRWPINIVLSADGDTAYLNHDGANHGATIIRNLNSSPNVGSVIATGVNPRGIALSPDGDRLYVANPSSATVSVIDTASGTVTSTVPTDFPWGISVHPVDQRVYVTHYYANTVTVFDSAMTPITSVPVGNSPGPFGVFIGTVPSPEADLAVAVTASQASRRVGQTASFGVGINNAGPDASGATTLDLMLNAATANMGLTAPAGWTCAAPVPGASDTTATCNTADMADGASAFFNVSVPVTDAMSAQPLMLSAVVDGSTGDPVPGDNSDSAEVAVTSDANLRLSFSGPNNVRSGIRIPVYARLDNYGANAARNPVVNLSVPLPAAAVSLTAPAGWSCTGGAAPRSIQITVVSTSFQCTYDTGLLPRTSVLFPLLITPPAYTAGSTIAITGNASSDSNDPVPGNNAASFNLNVRSSGGIISPVSPPIR